MSKDKPSDEVASTEVPAYWRSLEERDGSEGFQEAVEREFPSPPVLAQEAQEAARRASGSGSSTEGQDGVDRRQFLQLMGGGLALSSLTACTRQPLEKIVPFVRAPEELLPGRPLFYATAVTHRGGYAQGVLAESHMGRPTKLEGNPEHPGSLGATDVQAQAAIFDLYDPDRSQTVMNLSRIRTWESLLDALVAALGAQEGTGGAGLRILSGNVTSPSLAAQRDAIRARFPQMRWYQWEPCGARSARAASRAALGRFLHTRYDLSQADVVLTMESDLLTQGPGATGYARDFAQRRRVLRAGERMSRLYAVESSPTSTATLADHRLALAPGQVEAFALALVQRLGVAATGEAPGELPAEARRWLEPLARDLTAHPGRSVVVAGDEASPELHVLAHAINERLGNLGATVLHSEPPETEASDSLEDLQELTRELREGQVEVLLLLGVNPVYDAPADLGFVEAISNPASWFRLHYGLHQDETAEYCHWHVPATHFLESWGDARAWDGTVTIQQPLIEPLYGNRSVHALLAVLEGRTGTTAEEVVREHWEPLLGGEQGWRRALHDGFVPGTELAATTAGVSQAAVAEAGETIRQRAALGGHGTLELNLRPDPMLFDGRFANNPFLQECPRPFTKITWDNALLLSPTTAGELGLESHDVARVSADGRSLEVPVWVLPWHADRVGTLYLGYGRRRGGRWARGVGADANRLRTSDAFWSLPAVEIEPTGRRSRLASTQGHFDMENRHLVREATLDHYQANPRFAHDAVQEPDPDLTLFPHWHYPGYKWGMGIDLSSCTGCSACVVACQTENNIPWVGKEQVLIGRELHWLRIDQYYKGDDPQTAGVYNQPVPCMQCELAPCELVCPVAATIHSSEGLNDMVYNRCVGTRYCQNNCPYKVRRFNFFKYADWETESLKPMRNPDVTVRHRGVMEKCTYCVQRINAARIASEREGRRIEDGELKTACQQACPTGAIAFGDLNDPGGQATAWREQPRSYSLLGELNTRPRTTYLARLTNPNPELA